MQSYTFLHAELIVLPHCSPRGWLKSILLQNIFKSYPLENVSLRLFHDLCIKPMLFLKICIHYLLCECGWLFFIPRYYFFLVFSIEIMVNSSNISWRNKGSSAGLGMNIQFIGLSFGRNFKWNKRKLQRISFKHSVSSGQKQTGIPN